MGSASSASKRRPQRPENNVVVTSYSSLRSNHPEFRRRRIASSIPLGKTQFSRLAALSPLPRKVFTPFPAGDQAVGSIVKSFAVLPPAQCYTRFVSKHPPDRLRHRIECLFLPNDEGHLIVCSGLYLLRTGYTDLRVNNLYDGLVAQWSFGEEGQSDRCTVIRGSRSNNAFSLAATRRGRFLAWPSDGGIVVFDRYAATTCHRDSFFIGDSARAVDFGPDHARLAVVSSYERSFVLRVISSFDDRTPFKTLQETNLTSIDHTMTFRPVDNDHVSVKFSPSGGSIAVATRDGHFVVLSTKRADLPIIVMPHSFTAPEHRLQLRQMRLASLKAFDFAPPGSAGDGLDRLALATSFGEIILCSVSETSMEGELARLQIIPACDRVRRFNCLRFAAEEPWLVAAASSGEVLLLHSETLQPLSHLPLEPADIGPEPAHCPVDTHGFTSLCFSFSDSYLASGATDGRVRVWCLKRPTGPLLELCRRRIRTLCPKEQLERLPVHPVMLEFLGEPLAFRTDGE